MIDLSDVDYIYFVGQFMVNKELTSFSIFFFSFLFFLSSFFFFFLEDICVNIVKYVNMVMSEVVVTIVAFVNTVFEDVIANIGKYA